MTWEEQLQYKYTLDIDGHGGTWRLKHLFLSGSLVFKVDSPINQFWMPHLEPWVSCRGAAVLVVMPSQGYWVCVCVVGEVCCCLRKVSQLGGGLVATEELEDSCCQLPARGTICRHMALTAEPSLRRMQKHYIPVSWHDFESDLQLKLTWAKNNDAKAKQIMQAGKEWAEQHLNDRFVTWYQQQVTAGACGAVDACWSAPAWSAVCVDRTATSIASTCGAPRIHANQLLLPASAWCAPQVLVKLAQQQATHFSLVEGATPFCCSSVPEGDDWAHWKAKCLQYAPSSGCTQRETTSIYTLLQSA